MDTNALINISKLTGVILLVIAGGLIAFKLGDWMVARGDRKKARSNPLPIDLVKKPIDPKELGN